MHLFTAHRRETRRYFANFDLPLNPICWLFGHKARGTVKHWRYNIPPSLFIDCRWCDRRYRNPDADVLARKEQWTKETAQAHEARRLEVFLRDPKMVERSASGRDGYMQTQLHLGLELVDRSAEVKKRGLAKTFLEHAGVKFHLGDRGSETPFDGHVDLGAAAAYWSIGGVGGRLAEFLGRGQKRNLTLRVHGGQLWWELWYDHEGGNSEHEHRCDGWRQPTVWPWSKGRRKHRGWMCLRDGNLELNPANELWGRPRPTREVIATGDAFVEPGDFAGDTYLVQFKLERVTWAREHGPSWARGEEVSLAVDWDAGPGIPVRNHDWKGDESLSGHFPVLEHPGDGPWLAWASEMLLDQIRRDRRHYSYSPPKVTR